MRRTSHLYRRGGIWQWRRRLPVAPGTRGRPPGWVAVSTGTDERRLARIIASALTARSEELMALTRAGEIDARLFASIMREAHDQLLAELAEARAVRGRDKPRSPGGGTGLRSVPLDTV